jgi:hypothetical protein
MLKVIFLYEDNSPIFELTKIEFGTVEDQKFCLNYYFI